MDEDWLEAYREADDPNERYRLLRREAAQLRGEAARLRDEAGDEDLFDRDAVARTIREQNHERDGRLIVFAANDFGQPIAYLPETVGVDEADAVRRAILAEKYATDEELDEIRRAILDAHPRVHKVIVAEYDGDEVTYHLPEGSSAETNFLTVREMVGLVDYTVNSAQSEGLSRTY